MAQPGGTGVRMVTVGSLHALCGYDDLYELVETLSYDPSYSLWSVAYRSGPDDGVEFKVTESVLEPAERYAEQQSALVLEPVLG